MRGQCGTSLSTRLKHLYDSPRVISLTFSRAIIVTHWFMLRVSYRRCVTARNFSEITFMPNGPTNFRSTMRKILAKSCHFKTRRQSSIKVNRVHPTVIDTWLIKAFKNNCDRQLQTIKDENDKTKSPKSAKKGDRHQRGRAWHGVGARETVLCSHKATCCCRPSRHPPVTYYGTVSYPAPFYPYS